MTTRTKAIIAYLIIFLAGLSAGYMLNDFLPVHDREIRSGQYENGERNIDQRGEREWGRNLRDRANQRLSSHLNLTNEQRQQFFQIMDQYKSDIRDDIRQSRIEERSVIRSRYQEFRDEVANLLSESQLLRLDRIAHPDSVDHDRMQRPGRGNR